MKNHRLNTLADKYKVALESHHRAIDDTIALAGILNGLINDAAQLKGLTMLDRLNDFVGVDLSNTRPFHCGIYALNDVGKRTCTSWFPCLIQNISNVLRVYRSQAGKLAGRLGRYIRL